MSAMRWNRRLRIATTGILAAAVTLALTGCGGFGTSGSDETAVTSAPAPVAEEFAATEQRDALSYGGGDAGLSPEADKSVVAPGTGDKYVVTVASIEIRVDKLDPSVERLKALVKASGGEISNLSVNTGYVDPLYAAEGAAEGPKSATVTLRVPADKLESLQAQVEDLGTLISQSSNADDVTEQVIDLDARLKNLQAAEARLRELLARADKIADVLAVEQELSRVRGEIESMQAQLTYFKRQAARATLTVTLSEPAPIVSPGSTSWGFGEAVTNGIRGAVTVVNLAITAAIGLAPVWVTVLVVVAIVVWRRRARRARAAESTAGGETTPAE